MALVLVGTSPPTPALATENLSGAHRTSSEDAWKRPVRLTSRPKAYTYVAAATDKIAAVAWATGKGVRAKVRVPGDGWGKLRRLGGEGYGNPSVSANARGDLALAWMQGDELRVSRRPVGGRWTRPITLFRGTPAEGTNVPDVSVGPLGKVTVVLSISATESGVKRPRVFTFIDGRWSRPVSLTKRYGLRARAVTGPDGRVTIAWSTLRSGRCTVHGSNMSWSRPDCRAKPRSGWGLDLAVDEGGRVYLMTTRGVWSATPGTTWQREPVPGGDLAAFDTEEIAVDASAPGRAVVAWSQGEQVGRDRINFTTFASVRRSDGTWTRRKHLSNAPAAAAIAGNGTAYVAWSGKAGIRVARKVNGAAWGEPPAIVGKSLSGGPTLAATRSGDALLVFARDGVWAAWRP